MNELSYILTAVMMLGGIALLSAAVLYVVSRRFAVKEDPRVKEVQEHLPGANCGGCGFAGCAAFAEAMVKAVDAGTTGDMRCPVGGDETMRHIAGVLGVTATESAPMVAVVRCNGSCGNRPHTVCYEGLHTCAAVNATAAGETGCGYGCLGCGDCASACQFGGLVINPLTGLPEVDENVCTGCGGCVKACPRNIIELRKKGPKGHRVYVDCVSHDRGPVARKACQAACIGCGKCAKICQFDAITISGNLAYIDYEKCRMCTKCVDECPTGAIVKINFPVSKKKSEA